jgi:hypothetical protein
MSQLFQNSCMRKVLLLPFFLLYGVQLMSQNPIVVYLNDSSKVTVKDSATYIREAVIENGHYYITDKYINGRIYNYCEYSSINPWIEDGKAVHYSEDGKIYSEGLYKTGLLEGKWLYYKTDSSADTVYYSLEDLNNIISDCPDSRYYQNDKSSKVIGGLVIDSLMIFIENNFHMPARTRYVCRNFTAIINCTINSRGKVKCPEILWELPQDIVTEIFRILELFHYKAPIKKPFKISLAFPFDEEGHPENNIYFIVEKEPEFHYNNSLNGFTKYLEDNMKNLSSGFTGHVFLSFVMEKDGRMGEIQIIKGIDGCLGYKEEIENVFNSCNNWIPGMVHGKPVRTRLTTTVILR